MDARILGALATNATLWEVYVAPKPGLVDRYSQGAHGDMDYALFLRSARALAPLWAFQGRLGAEGVPPEDALPPLRRHGLVMEKAMFEATGGVNTHKGLIYVLSLLLYGAGRALFLGLPPDPRTLCARGGEPCRNAVAHELLPLRSGEPPRPLTHGERLFRSHGVTGVRGEAARGFPSLRRGGIPAFFHSLRQGNSWHDAALDALLVLMELCEDSNIMHRGGYELWEGPYRRMVRATRKRLQGGASRAAMLEDLDHALMSRRLSPGGAADLLTGTLFLALTATVRTSSRTCRLTFHQN